MPPSARRSDYDVTNTVRVSSAADVRDAVQELLESARPGLPFAPVARAFHDFEMAFTGRMPGYFGVDTVYHDQQHTLDVTLAMARLMVGYERSYVGTDMALGAERAAVGIFLALFHDIGYLRERTEEAQNGAEFTRNHVTRSARFMDFYLRWGCGGPLSGHSAASGWPAQQGADDVGCRHDADDPLVVVDDRQRVHARLHDQAGHFFKTRGRPATRDWRPHDLLNAETRIEEGRAIGGAAGRKVLHLHQVGGTQHPDQALVADDGQVMDRVVQEAVERFADGTVDFDHDHGLGHDPRYRLFGSHGPRVLRRKDSAGSGSDFATRIEMSGDGAANDT